MSDNSISDRKPQSYEDFVYRFQLAQGLPRDDKGVIFIGNTRAGKSTLALAMSGEPMKVVYEDGALTYLNPSDKLLMSIVRNTQQSVTEKPNFYASRKGHNQWAIVDMPGHADSSRFRQLINFHYIRTMAANLKQVRFLIVVTLQHRNGRFVMPDKQVQMLHSFQVMFPNCSNCVNIIINRVKEAAINTGPAAACFRDTVIHSKIPGISNYYGSITNKNIFVIERPPYKEGPNGEGKHQAPYHKINKIMQEICNSNSEFMKLSEHSYYALNIFKQGDHAKNKDFYLKLLEINYEISEGVTAAKQLFQKAILTLIEAVVEKGTCRVCEEQLINIFNIFLGKHTIDAPQKKSITPLILKGQILLESTKIFQLLDFVTSDDFKLNNQIQQMVSRDALKLGEKYSRKITDNYCSKLLKILQGTFGKAELYTKVMDYYLFLDRKITESYFIANIVSENEDLGKGEEKQELMGQIHRRFQQFTEILNQKFTSPFEKIVKSSINLNIASLFRNYHPGQYDQLKDQIFDNFNLIQKMGYLAFKDNDTFTKVILTKMEQKKNQVQFFVLTNSEPSNPQQASTQIEKLLKAYQATDLSMKIKVVHKLTRLLQSKSEIKHTLALSIHLNLNEEAMRLINALVPTIKKDSLAEFYSETATAFEENGMFLYAQKCLQGAKMNSIDELDKFIQYQRRILNLNDPRYTSKILQKRLQAKDISGYWNWANLDNQILFLKQKYRLKDQSPTKSVFLKSYR